MEIIPAIDIMRNKVVRLRKGQPHTAKTYNNFKDPLQAAKWWEKEGANYLHVVDLDAATGLGDNKQTVLEIIQNVDIPVQVGGGIRNKAVAEEMLTMRAERVILATLAFESEPTLNTLVEKFGCERIMVALDYLNGVVMARGWMGSTGITLMKALENFSNVGVELFLLTSISRDGLLIGPDYATLKVVVNSFDKRFFIAGGISNLHEIVQLKSMDVDGIVIGKALYEERFSLKDALEAVRG